MRPQCYLGDLSSAAGGYGKKDVLSPNNSLNNLSFVKCWPSSSCGTREGQGKDLQLLGGRMSRLMGSSAWMELRKWIVTNAPALFTGSFRASWTLHHENEPSVWQIDVLPPWQQWIWGTRSLLLPAAGLDQFTFHTALAQKTTWETKRKRASFNASSNPVKAMRRLKMMKVITFSHFQMKASMRLASRLLLRPFLKGGKGYLLFIY